MVAGISQAFGALRRRDLGFRLAQQVTIRRKSYTIYYDACNPAMVEGTISTWLPKAHTAVLREASLL